MFRHRRGEPDRRKVQLPAQFHGERRAHRSDPFQIRCPLRCQGRGRHGPRQEAGRLRHQLAHEEPPNVRGLRRRTAESVNKRARLRGGTLESRKDAARHPQKIYHVR